MYGKDVERVVEILNRLKDETSKQIEALSYESDFRINTIDHTHTVHVEAATGSPEGTPSGPHGHPDGTHVNIIDLLLTGRDDPRATDYRYPDYNHNGPDHFDHVSDQLTYPIFEERGYLRDLHNHHKHIEPKMVYEREHPDPANQYVDPIVDIGKELQKDLEKMKDIEDNMYTEKETFNNNYGSPWKEIYILKEKIDIVEKYGKDFPELQWIGEKHTLMSLMHIVLSYTVDAKWAFIVYQDWMQRAYDHRFNDNTPAITWDKFKDTTMGQWEQEFDENVNIKKPSKDPY